MALTELDLTARLGIQAVSMDWEAVYTEMLPRVYNYFRYHGLEEVVVEDLTAITFEKAWRKRSSYRHDLSAFSTWLLRIAHNVAMDYFRSRPQEIKLADYEVKAGQGSPEDQILEQDDLDHLGRLLAQLPTREQELVALKYGSGLTNRAIAQMTGLSETNVGTILYRVVNHLRECWGNGK